MEFGHSSVRLTAGNSQKKREVTQIRIMNGLQKTVFRNGRLLLEEDDSIEDHGLGDEGNETCNECGQSVRIGSGRFVNRVIDFSGYKTRMEMGKPYPIGDYICADCETTLDGQPGEALRFPEQGMEE